MVEQPRPVNSTLDDVAARLRCTPRWLRDWLRAHPGDRRGVPFFFFAGRKKLFTAADIERIESEMREETKQKIGSTYLGFRRSTRRYNPSARTETQEALDLIRASSRTPRR